MIENNYFLEAEIGNGTFSSVYRVRDLIDNHLYAMKKIKYQEASQKVKENALNQIRILSSIDHKNIIGYKESFFTQKSGDLCVVMQLAEKGSLGSEIKRRYQLNQYFSQAEIWKMGYNIIQGINALHSRQIIHRDIKPDNILLGYGNFAKIGDMNISIFSGRQFLFDQVGTPYYSSPQVWVKGPYGYQCDIWSFGCVLHQMCSLRKAFDGKNLERILRKIKMCRFKQIPMHYSDDLKLLISRCLTYSHKRISKQELRSIFMGKMRVKQQKRVQRAKSLNLMNAFEGPAQPSINNRAQSSDMLQYLGQDTQIIEQKKPKKYLDKYLQTEKKLLRKYCYEDVCDGVYNSNTKLTEKIIKGKFERQISSKVKDDFKRIKPSLLQLLEDQRQIISQIRLRFDI